MPFAVAFANLKLPQKGTLLLAGKKGRDLGALGRDLDKKTGGGGGAAPINNHSVFGCRRGGAPCCSCA